MHAHREQTRDGNIALPSSEQARAALVAGGPPAVAALMKDGPEAAQQIIEAQRTHVQDTLSITRSEAELFREALNHLPGFYDGEQERAALIKLRAFLSEGGAPAP